MGTKNNGTVSTTERAISEREIDTKFSQLKFYTNLSIRYHMQRKSFFASWHYFIMAVTSILGASSFMLLYAGSDDLSKKLALITSAIVGLLTALDAVIGFMRKYSLHDELQRKFIDLANEIEVSEKIEENYKKLLFKRRIVEKEEPKDLNALHILCYNQETIAMGLNEQIFKTNWKIWFRHYWSFDTWIPKKIDNSSRKV